MRKGLVVFWFVLAGLYGALAVTSFLGWHTYDDKVLILAERFPMQVTRDRHAVESGNMKLDSQGRVIVGEVWKDFRAYLKASMWVNVIGFVLAAMAAFWSGRQGDGKITAEY